MNPSVAQLIVAALALCWFSPPVSAPIHRRFRRVIHWYNSGYAALLDVVVAILTGVLIAEWWALLIPLVAVLPAVPKLWRDQEFEFSPLTNVSAFYLMAVLMTVVPIAIGISVAR